MKRFLALALAAAACAAPPANPPAPEGMPAPPAPTEEHLWLRQLVGTWDVVAEMEADPESGAPVMRARFRETVEPLGDYWILSRLEADFGDRPFRSSMTVGWDPARSAFVGSWVDSFSTHQWVYQGSLDAERRALSLEADGPSFADPSTITRFRDVTEFEGPDLRRNSSWMQGPDGEWMLFARATATRRR